MAAGPTGWYSFASFREVEKEEEKETLSWNLFWRVCQIGFPYRFRICLVLSCLVVSSLLSMVRPFVVRVIVDQALVQGDKDLLALLVPMLVIVPLLSGLVHVVQSIQTGYVGSHLTSDLRELLFNYFQKMGIGFYTETKTGEITARMQSDVYVAQQAITGIFMQTITNTITIIFAIGFLLSVDVQMTLYSVLIIPLFYLPAKVVAKRIRKISEESSKSYGQLSAFLTEVLTRDGILLMRLFGRQEKNYQDFKERNDNLNKSGHKTLVVGTWFSLVVGLISAIGTAVIYWYGGSLVIEGKMSVGTIIAFSSYLSMLYSPIASLMNSRVQLISALVGFERVFEVVDLCVEVKEKEDGLNISNFEGAVHFENISFSYDGSPPQQEEEESKREEENHNSKETLLSSPSSSSSTFSKEKVRFRKRKRGVFFEARYGNRNGKTVDYTSDRPFTWVLQDISFQVQPGQTVALVGPSGAGKSTILSLLPRLYDPTLGNITIDSYNLKDLSFSSISRAVGMVAQDTFLFHDTIRNNLLYASPTATEMDLIEACEAAHILDVIMSWPEKWETVVGERGYRLSGGEKQRVSIARVILQDPKIILLDEATASLDSRSEEAIQTALEKLYVKKQHSFLVIAHRLSTILSADQILVVDQGRIVEKGNHSQLLKMDGLYTSLYHTQFRKEREQEEESRDEDGEKREAEKQDRVEGIGKLESGDHFEEMRGEERGGLTKSD